MLTLNEEEILSLPLEEVCRALDVLVQEHIAKSAASAGEKHAPEELTADEKFALAFEAGVTIRVFDRSKTWGLRTRLRCAFARMQPGEPWSVFVLSQKQKKQK